MMAERASGLLGEFIGDAMIERMTSTSSSGIEAACLVCQEQRGDVAVPGGLLEASELAIVFHVPPPEDARTYLGHLLVTPRRHVADFAGLESNEAAEIGVQIHRFSAALKQLGAARVYVATIGHGVDHLHVHLLPRWPETPDAVPWHAVDEWPGARQGDVFAARELVEQIRSLVA
jgi:histidine triad (HIT) family protein